MESLLIHELGHAIGFDHILESFSVMNPRLPNGYRRVNLGSLELSSLNCEYKNKKTLSSIINL